MALVLQTTHIAQSIKSHGMSTRFTAVSDLTIQLAVDADARAIVDVLRAAFDEFESLYTPDAFMATVSSESLVRRRMTEGPVWIARRHDCAVGTVSAARRGSGAYIRGMAVLPSERRSGIGRHLMQHATNWAASEGASRVYLSTTPFLHDAIRLYESLGFIRVDDPPHELFGTPLFTMERRSLAEHL